MKKKHGKKRRHSKAVDSGRDRSAQLSSVSRSFPSDSLKSRSLLWILPALVAVNLFIYAQVRRHEFTHWDDPSYVSQNPEVSRGLTWQGVRWAFTTGHVANWHPLTWLSHMFDVQLFGVAPGPPHLISVLFHIANTLLLFWILFRMTAAAGQSAFVAGLFAAHPLHVESVAWIAERKDVLSTFFLMLTIWAYIAYVRRTGSRRYLLVVALFVLALMAKPMVVTLPLILLLLDIWPLGRLHPGPGQWPACLRLIREKIPLIVLALASGVVTLGVQWHGGSIANTEVYPLSGRAANALISYVAYIIKMLWPTGLSVFYPYSTLPGLWVVGSFLALTGVSVMAVRSAGRHPFFLVGWMWYLVTLVPVIGLIQVGAQARADRYTYVPLIGIFIVIAWGAPEILGRLHYYSLPLAIGECALVCVLAIAARNQTGYWVNGVVLWEHALRLFPGSHLVHLNAGFELNDRGETTKAMQHYAEALRIKPDFAEAHNALGVALVKQGNVQEALEHFTLALRAKPNYADANSNLGVRLTDLGKTDEAISHLAAALRTNPDNAEIHYNMGLALVRQGKNDEAITHFSEAVRLKPDFVEAYNWWGSALSNQGKLDDAIAQYNKALRINPDFADAHNDLGIALASQGKLDEAIIQYKEALRVKPNLAEAHNGLGNALSNQNKLDEAIGQYKEAIRIAPNFAEVHQNLGVALARQGKPDDAVVQYKEALRLNPDLAEAHCSLGDSFLFQKRNNEAIAQYKEALRIKPYFAEAHYDLGIALMNQGLFDEAIVHFTEVLRITPDNIGAHGNLSIALINKGREREAIPHLTEVLRMRPDDKTAENLLKTTMARLKEKAKRSANVPGLPGSP